MEGSHTPILRGNVPMPILAGIVFFLPVSMAWILLFKFSLYLEQNWVVYGLVFITFGFGINGAIKRLRLKNFSQASFLPTKIFLILITSLAVIVLFHLYYLIYGPKYAIWPVVAAFIAFTPMPKKLRALLAGLFCAVLAAYLGSSGQLLGVSCALIYTLYFLVAYWKQESWVLPGYWLFVTLVAVVFLFMLYGFFRATTSNVVLQKILSQSGIHAIFIHGEKDSSFDKKIGGKSRFVTENCDGSLLVGSRSLRAGYGLHIITGDNFIFVPVKYVSDFVIPQCEQKRIWAGEYYKDEIVEVDSDTGKIKDRISGFNLPGIARLQLGVDGKTLFAASDTGNSVLVYDTEVKSKSLISFDHMVTDFFADTKTDSLVTSRPGGMVYSYSLTSHELKNKKMYADLVVQLETDQENGVGYATRFLSGELIKFDSPSLKEISKRKMQPGIRYVWVDSKNRRLFVANFLTGWCDCLDSESLEVLDRKYFGPRLRNITLSNNGKLLYGSSMAGAFAWKVPPINSHNKT